MFGSSRPSAGAALPTDSTELLQQIARNTAEVSRWMKYLVVAVLILIVVMAVAVV